MVNYKNIEEVIDINGNEYQVVVNHSDTKNAPLFIYINKITEFSTFGGYTYSINDRNQQDKVYQLVIKTGNNEEMIKNLSQLMCKKYKVPNYCNVNNLEDMDYPMLLKRLNELMTYT